MKYHHTSMSHLITPDQFFKAAAAIMKSQSDAAQEQPIKCRIYREPDTDNSCLHGFYAQATPEPTEDQPTERWTNATHHSMGNGCYQVRRQGGAQ